MAKTAEQLLDEIKVIHNQMEGLKLLFDNKKAVLQKYFDKTGETKVNSEEVTASVQKRVDIHYDIEAIKEKVPSDIYVQFIDKAYSIPDFKAFKKVVKSLEIDMKPFKNVIKVKEEVNQKQLDKLYKEGIITIKDMTGCYEADVKKSIVVRFKNINSEIPLERKDELK